MECEHEPRPAALTQNQTQALLVFDLLLFTSGVCVQRQHAAGCHVPAQRLWMCLTSVLVCRSQRLKIHIKHILSLVSIKHFVSTLKGLIHPTKCLLAIYCSPLCGFRLRWHFTKPSNLSGVSWMDGIPIPDLQKKKMTRKKKLLQASQQNFTANYTKLSWIISLLNVNEFKKMSP